MPPKTVITRPGARYLRQQSLKSIMQYLYTKLPYHTATNLCDAIPCFFKSRLVNYTSNYGK